MKIIQSIKHKQLKADTLVHPPIDKEVEPSITKDKKKKKIYQLGLWVDDLDIKDFVE